MNKTIRTMLAFLMVISMVAPAMAIDGMIIAEASAKASNGGGSVYTYASVENPSGMVAETGTKVYGCGYGASGAYGTESSVGAGSYAYSDDDPVSWSSASIPGVTASRSFAVSDGVVWTNANAWTGGGSANSNAGAYAYGDYFAYTQADTNGNSGIGSTYVSVNSYAIEEAYAQSNVGTVVKDNGDIQSNGDAYAWGYDYAGTGYNYGYAWVYNSEDSANAVGTVGATGTSSAYADVGGNTGSNWANVWTYGYGYGQATAGTSIDVSVGDI